MGMFVPIIFNREPMPSQEPIIWLNGRLVPASAACISPFDRGFTVGCAAFETLRARRGQPFAVTRHWRRLVHSCQILGIQPPLLDVFKSCMTETLEANHLKEARVRFTVTAGDGQTSTASFGAGQTLVVHAVPIQSYADREQVVTVPWSRNERSVLTGAKCASYAENMIALAFAHKQGCGEAIFANTQGDLCEGATTNVFIVQDGVVLTPSTASGCLPGITREIVLELCKLNNIGVEETKLPMNLFEEAEECFLTSSTRGLQPIAKVGVKQLSNNSHSLTLEILKFYHKLFIENDDP